MRRSGLPILVFLVLLAAPLAPAQNPAPKPPAPSQAAFVGFLKSTIDSAPVRSADVRLFFVDSARELVEPLGLKSIETFVDTLRSRVVSSDSVGYFAVWHLA